MDKLLEVLKSAGIEVTDDLKTKIKDVWPDTSNLLTQEKVDDIVKERLARAERLHEQELNELRGKMEKLVDPSQVEKVKGEFKEQLESTQKARLADIKRYELKLAATKAGVKDLDYIEFLLDKQGYSDRLGIDDQGNVYVTDKEGKVLADDKGQKFGPEKLINELKETKPDLFGEKNQKNIGSGSNPAGGGNNVSNPWERGKTNLTEQARLLKENTALAKQFITSAGYDPSIYGL